MANINFLTRIFNYLEADAGILAAFGATNITPELIPIKVDAVKLTVEVNDGRYSDHDVDEAELILKIWVRKDKFTGSPNGWVKCKQLQDLVDDYMNLSGGSIENVYNVRRRLKTSPEIDPDDVNLYMGIIIYEVNKYEG